MSAPNGKRERATSSPAEIFPHAVGDVVLVRWSDERIYYAKIKTINKNRQTCQVMFEDNRRGTADFDQIHAVDSAVEDWIACIVCKFGTSDPPNQIVLCDKCGVAFHQKCHQPNISDSALEPSAPWVCHFCEKGQANPHLKQTDEDTPFAEEESKPIGRRRLSSAAVNNSFPSGVISHRKQKRRKREEEEEEETSSGESTHSTSSSIRTSESSSVSAIGKRPQAELSDNSPASPPPAKKKRASPTPSTLPTRKTREETSRKDGLQSLQASVIDSQKVVAYAKWKQDKIQTTESERNQRILNESAEIKTKVVAQTRITSAPIDSIAPPPTTKVLRVAPHRQPGQEFSRAPQATGVQKTSTDTITVQVGQIAALARHQAIVAAPEVSNKASTHQVKYCKAHAQVKTTGSTANTLGTLTKAGSSIKGAIGRSSADLPPTSLASMAEHFEMHYSILMSSLHEARSRISKHINVGATTPGRRTDTSSSHVSQLRDPQLNGEQIPSAPLRHKKLSGLRDQALQTHQAVFPPSVVVSHQSTSKHSTQQDTASYKCAGCGEHAQFVCSRCQHVWYCSRECQEQSYMLFCRSCASRD